MAVPPSGVRATPRSSSCWPSAGARSRAAGTGVGLRRRQVQDEGVPLAGAQVVIPQADGVALEEERLQPRLLARLGPCGVRLQRLGPAEERRHEGDAPSRARRRPRRRPRRAVRGAGAPHRRRPAGATARPADRPRPPWRPGRAGRCRTRGCRRARTRRPLRRPRSGSGAGAGPCPPGRRPTARWPSSCRWRAAGPRSRRGGCHRVRGGGRTGAAGARSARSPGVRS